MTYRSAISGFLPIHAVTANGLESVYDFMTGTDTPDGECVPRKYRAVIMRALERARARAHTHTHKACTHAHTRVCTHIHIPVCMHAYYRMQDPKSRSSLGRMREANVHGLQPLQLAARFGNHDYVKFLMRKQCAVLWVWGPVTMHSIDMRGIDSTSVEDTNERRVGHNPAPSLSSSPSPLPSPSRKHDGPDPGHGYEPQPFFYRSLMDLITGLDAEKGCHELLLDNFMQGMMNRLFADKWNM